METSRLTENTMTDPNRTSNEHNNAPAVPTDSDPTSKEQYRRMFVAACEALGAISDALGCDPEDGGAEPILGAVEELQISLGLSNGILGCLSAAPAVPQGEPVAWLDLSKLSASAMVYATGWKSNDKQSPLYTTPAHAPAQEQCNACLGTGRMVRDPDIGTDQECFVCDGSGYEPEQEVGLTEGEIQALGHRIATTYRHDEDGFRRQYAFNIYTLVDFANAIIAALRAKGGK